MEESPSHSQKSRKQPDLDMVHPTPTQVRNLLLNPYRHPQPGISYVLASQFDETLDEARRIIKTIKNEHFAALRAERERRRRIQATHGRELGELRAQVDRAETVARTHVRIDSRGSAQEYVSKFDSNRATLKQRAVVRDLVAQQDAQIEALLESFHFTNDHTEQLRAAAVTELDNRGSAWDNAIEYERQENAQLRARLAVLAPGVDFHRTPHLPTYVPLPHILSCPFLR